MRITPLALLPLIGGLTGAALAVATPQTAQAEKLQGDCPGRYTECKETKNCTRYEEHRCVERTTEIWHYFFTPPSPR